MRFCSECDSLLVPKEPGSKTLTCKGCGHEEKLDEESDYKFGEEKSEKKSSEVAVVEKEKKKKVKEPEYDIDQDFMADVYDEMT